MNTSTAAKMGLNTVFLAELQHEAATARKCLERIPDDKFDWKPHEKSFTMARLATHVAEMVNWIKVTAETTELDFNAEEYKPFEPKTTAELLEFFDKNVAEATEALQNVSDEAMMADWTLRNGDQIYFTMPRVQCLRSMCFNHIIHHRGQLTVYLRLNDIPVPSIYGPSADEGEI